MDVPGAAKSRADAFKQPEGEVQEASVERRKPESGRAPKTFRWAWWIALSVLVAVGWLLYKAKTSETVVTVETATSGTIQASFTAEGFVKGKDYFLSPETGGTISNLLVSEGDAVHAGQILLTLDDAEARTALSQAQAAALASKADLEQAKGQLNLARTSSAARIKAAESNLRQAQARRSVVMAGARSQEIAQGRHRVEALKAGVDQADRTYKRAQYLYGQGAIPRAQQDAAEAGSRTARAQLAEAEEALSLLRAGSRPEEIAAADAAVEAARADLMTAKSTEAEVPIRANAVSASAALAEAAAAAVDRAKTAVSKLELRAPTDGIISKVNVEKGTLAAPSTPALVLSTRQDLRIDAEISTEDAAKVKKGMAVQVTSPAYPGRTFPAKLVSLSPIGELKPDAAIRTRIVRARVELLDKWNLFRPGMEVDVEGVSDMGKGILISNDALSFSGNAASVWVLQPDHRVIKRTVTTGLTTATQTEVLSGIKAGDLVVIEGKDQLREGSRVRTKQ